MGRLLLLSLLFASCAGDKVPKEIFPPAKMQAILFDVIRADELVDFVALQDSAYRDFTKRSALYDSIFHIHAISKEDFRKSLQYYQGRPDLLKGILDSLHAQTESKTDTMMKKPIKPQLIKPD